MVGGTNAKEPSPEAPAVRRRGLEPAGAVDHVAVRDDVAIRRDDEARTGSRRRGAAAPWTRPRRDADNGRPHALDHRDDDSRVGVQEPAVVRLPLSHALSTSTPFDAAGGSLGPSMAR